MKKVIDGLANFPLYLISLLPFRVLYIVADLLYVFLYYIIKYRRTVVTTNLRNSFPEKSDNELISIEKKFYINLVDTMVETLKMASISQESLKKRLIMRNPEEISKYYADGRRVLIVTGHYGNWEWGPPIISSMFTEPVLVVFKPVSNKRFERILNGWRSRFGAVMVPMKQTLRALVSMKSQSFSLALVGDQTPVKSETHYYTIFLNQQTPIFLGVEKIAVRSNMPVVYAHLNRLKRGFYECTLTTLFARPRETKEYEITDTHTRFLEQIIIRRPEMWLWSHKRWKFKESDL